MAINSNACPTCSEIFPIIAAEMLTSSHFQFILGNYNGMLTFFELKYPFLVIFQNTTCCLVFPSIDYEGFGIIYSIGSRATDNCSLCRVNADTPPYLGITKLSLTT